MKILFFSGGLWKRTDKDFSGLVFELGEGKMISCVPSPAPRRDDSEPFQGNMISLISNSASLLCIPPNYDSRWGDLRLHSTFRNLIDFLN